MSRANYIARGTASFVLMVAGLWVTVDVFINRPSAVAAMALGLGMLLGGMTLGNDLLSRWLRDGRKFVDQKFRPRVAELPANLRRTGVD